jgi:hypothetical protein
MKMRIACEGDGGMMRMHIDAVQPGGAAYRSI